MSFPLYMSYPVEARGTAACLVVHTRHYGYLRIAPDPDMMLGLGLYSGSQTSYAREDIMYALHSVCRQWNLAPAT